VFRSASRGETIANVTNVFVYPTVCAEYDRGKCVVVRTVSPEQTVTYDRVIWILVHNDAISTSVSV
jgi:hypothetical protein